MLLLLEPSLAKPDSPPLFVNCDGGGRVWWIVLHKVVPARSKERPSAWSVRETASIKTNERDIIKNGRCGCTKWLRGCFRLLKKFQAILA